MPLNFLDLCIIQAMSNPHDLEDDNGPEALKKWATRVIERAQALDAARQAIEEKQSTNDSERVNKELATRSEIS